MLELVGWEQRTETANPKALTTHPTIQTGRQPNLSTIRLVKGPTMKATPLRRDPMRVTDVRVSSKCSINGDKKVPNAKQIPDVKQFNQKLAKQMTQPYPPSGGLHSYICVL